MPLTCSLKLHPFLDIKKIRTGMNQMSTRRQLASIPQAYSIPSVPLG